MGTVGTERLNTTNSKGRSLDKDILDRSNNSVLYNKNKEQAVITELLNNFCFTI